MVSHTADHLRKFTVCLPGQQWQRHRCCPPVPGLHLPPHHHLRRLITDGSHLPPATHRLGRKREFRLISEKSDHERVISVAKRGALFRPVPPLQVLATAYGTHAWRAPSEQFGAAQCGHVACDVAQLPKQTPEPVCRRRRVDEQAVTMHTADGISVRAVCSDIVRARLC
jgi:hypothetical protein